MSDQDRRQFLKGLLGRLVQSAGVVVLASAAASRAHGEQTTNDNSQGDVRERADKLARNGRRAADGAEEPTQPVGFLNLSFGRPPVGIRPPIADWRNGGWDNGNIGGWRNRGGGNFRNGGWVNTGWPNGGLGGWRNGGVGGWTNGGWPNGGWRNVFF
jgi:hypothetical protein